MASSNSRGSSFQRPTIKVHAGHDMDEKAAPSQLVATHRYPAAAKSPRPQTIPIGIEPIVNFEHLSTAASSVIEPVLFGSGCNCQVPAAMGICWACEDGLDDDLASDNDSCTTVTDKDNIETLTPLLGIR